MLTLNSVASVLAKNEKVLSLFRLVTIATGSSEISSLLSIGCVTECWKGR